MILSVGWWGKHDLVDGDKGMKERKVILKPGKEKPLLRYHQWIFSGAVEMMPSFEEGEILPVFSSSGSLLGSAYFQSGSSIVGHMLSFQGEEVFEALERKLTSAMLLRKELFPSQKTNSFRLIHAEGDGFPGLIVDKFDKILVLQIANQGMERLKPFLLEKLIALMQPEAIWEKSSSSLRKREGLEKNTSLLWGTSSSLIPIRENKMNFYIDLLKGQKTGFFLDQREMRLLVERMAEGKRVWNGFCYTGGFSLFALRGGASFVESRDSSASCLEILEKNLLLNALETKNHQSIRCDVVEVLRKIEKLDFDFVILDPPAFAKKKQDLEHAFVAYKEMNAQAMKKMPERSLLLTSSCSSYLSEELFGQMLFQAAHVAKRKVRILQEHCQAQDHPISLYHPEGRYLKSALLYIE